MQIKYITRDRQRHTSINRRQTDSEIQIQFGIYQHTYIQEYIELLSKLKALNTEEQNTNQNWQTQTQIQIQIQIQPYKNNNTKEAGKFI